MPGPGRGFGGRGRFGGPGRAGPGFGRGPRFGRGLGPLGFVGAVATGAAIASMTAPPPPRRRYPAPRPGYIYVVSSAGQAPRAVSAEETSFIIKRIMVASFQRASGGEIFFEVEVTMTDGYKYTVMRRYSQFDQLGARVTPHIRMALPPFPPRHGWRSATVGLRPEDLEERRTMLQTWIQSLCTAAAIRNPALRIPLYDFLETTAYYPPEVPATTSTTNSSDAERNSANATATAAKSSDGQESLPCATATPYAETIGSGGKATGVGSMASAPASAPTAPQNAKSDDARSSDDWGVPMESREASDLKLAMAGPDASGRLSAGKAADALREGTQASAEDLRAVWELADIDHDGMLDREEFAVAWYLGHQAAAGNKPPPTLPSNIVPPSKRSAPPRSSNNPF